MKKTLLVLGLAVLGLLLAGFVLLASAGTVQGERLYGDPHYFVTHQAVWLFVAMVPFWFSFFFDYRYWRRWPLFTGLVYIVTCLMLAAVFAFPARKGARRWIALGPVTIQPGELAKIVAVLATAVFIDWIGWKIALFWKGGLPAGLILGVLAGLVVVEPDFGSTLVLAGTGAVMLIMGGTRILHLFLLGVAGGCLVVPMLLKNANRMRRLVAWLPPDLADRCIAFLHLPVEPMDADKVNTALHQKNQALLAFENGGLHGLGFNQSLQKHVYLPEAHTDFIFAIGAEEWGLAASLLLLALFAAFFICGLLITRHAPDRLGRLIAAGMTFLVVFQALFNIGVVTGSLPTKGIALPFISYGGTNLVVSLTAAGVLFNIGRKCSTARGARYGQESGRLRPLPSPPCPERV